MERHQACTDRRQILPISASSISAWRTLLDSSTLAGVAAKRSAKAERSHRPSFEQTCSLDRCSDRGKTRRSQWSKMQQRRRLAFRTVRIKHDQRPAISASLKKKHLKISRAWQDSLAVSESLVLVSNSHFQYWEVRKACTPGRRSLSPSCCRILTSTSQFTFYKDILQELICMELPFSCIMFSQ